MEDRKVRHPEEWRREVEFLGSTKDPLEVPGDEIKVKLASVIVFFFSHIQMYGG